MFSGRKPHPEGEENPFPSFSHQPPFFWFVFVSSHKNRILQREEQKKSSVSVSEIERYGGRGSEKEGDCKCAGWKICKNFVFSFFCGFLTFHTRECVTSASKRVLVRAIRSSSALLQQQSSTFGALFVCICAARPARWTRFVQNRNCCTRRRVLENPPQLVRSKKSTSTRISTTPVVTPRAYYNPANLS